MRKYYISHVDFSEIDAISNDETTREIALTRLNDAGAIDSDGNPDINYLNTLSGSVSIPFFTKLERRLSRRRGGVESAYEILQRLYDNEEYTAMYLYTVIMYGFIEWQVPQVVSMLPAVPEALKAFMSEFIADFSEFINEIDEDEEEYIDETEPADEEESTDEEELIDDEAEPVDDEESDIDDSE